MEPPRPPHLRLDVLLRGGDEAGAAQPQHDHDGQKEAGGQNPPREAGAPAGGGGGRGLVFHFEAFKSVQDGGRLTWTCSRGSRARPRRPLRAGRRACLCRLLYLPSPRGPSPLRSNRVLSTARREGAFRCLVFCVLTVRPLGVGVDLGPGFVRHVGPGGLQLGGGVLHLRLALRRERKQE